MSRFIEIECSRCKEAFGMAVTTYETLKRSSATFHCPWGHEQYFPLGPSEEDKLRVERNLLKQRLAEKDDELMFARDLANREAVRREHAERRVSAAKGQITKLRKRAAAGVCPCCNRQFVNLQRHMNTKHKGFVAEEINLDGVTIQ